MAKILKKAAGATAKKTAGTTTAKKTAGATTAKKTEAQLQKEKQAEGKKKFNANKARIEANAKDFVEKMAKIAFNSYKDNEQKYEADIEYHLREGQKNQAEFDRYIKESKWDIAEVVYFELVADRLYVDYFKKELARIRNKKATVTAKGLSATQKKQIENQAEKDAKDFWRDSVDDPQDIDELKEILQNFERGLPEAQRKLKEAEKKGALNEIESRYKEFRCREYIINMCEKQIAELKKQNDEEKRLMRRNGVSMPYHVYRF